MNKKILATGLALAILSSGAGVFAEDSDIMLINEDPGVVTELENKSVITKEMVTVEEEGLEIAEDTLLYNNAGEKITAEDIKKDAMAILFKDAEEKLIAVVLINEESPANADLDLYTESDTFGDLVNAKFDLALHISDEIEITDLEGTEVEKEALAGKNLLVFYTQVAMSLPGQTTPEKIVVVGEPEAVEEPETDGEETEKEYSYTVEVSAEDIRKDEEAVMLPLRAVSEGLGYEVGWDNELQKITVGTIPMGVNFVVGVNEYNKSRMMPFVLEKAPELIVTGDFGVTYVPASFFTDVLVAEVVENEDGSITVRQ